MNGGMKKKFSNETIAGIFVVIGLIGVAYLILNLGDVNLISRETYSLYAQFRSVTGLRSGNAVEVLGVQAGEVAGIRMDQKNQVAIAELRIKKSIVVYDDAVASIRTAGLIGDMYVSIQPGGAGEVLKPGQVIEKTDYPFEDITEAAKNFPIDEIAVKLSSTLLGIEQFITSQELLETIHNLNQTLIVVQNFVQRIDTHVEPVISGLHNTERSIQKLADNVDEQLEPMMSSITAAAIAARRALSQMEKTLALEHGQPARLASSLREAADAIKKTAEAARPVLSQAEKSFANIRSLTDRESQEIYSINETLKELSAAARAVRHWAEYLERHPEALIRGKGGISNR